jgi:hypothetical protein
MTGIGADDDCTLSISTGSDGFAESRTHIIGQTSLLRQSLDYNASGARDHELASGRDHMIHKVPRLRDPHLAGQATQFLAAPVAIDGKSFAAM